MTRFQLAILFALPLAFVVGCGDPNCTGDECNDNVDCDDNCGDDDTATPGEFEATLRNVAPYNLVGDHEIVPIESAGDETGCTDVNECSAALNGYGNFEIRISGDTFECVPQVQLVREADDGSTVDVTSPWTGEGICSVVPNGTYSGLDVSTDIYDFINGVDQMTIQVGTWYAVITGNEFLYDRKGYYLEGTVSDDLSSIEYYAISGSGGEFGGIIYLEED